MALYSKTPGIANTGLCSWSACSSTLGRFVPSHLFPGAPNTGGAKTLSRRRLLSMTSCRPRAERTAAGRYNEPSLFSS